MDIQCSRPTIAGKGYISVIAECSGAPAVSVAKCTDGYQDEGNKLATLSQDAMQSKTIPLNCLLKELMVLLCQGCRDEATALVEQPAQNRNIKSHFSS